MKSGFSKEGNNGKHSIGGMRSKIVPNYKADNDGRKRLIDADTLLETIHDAADGLADCDQQNAAWALLKYAARDIMDATTVDAVEVVRCKDCKWFADNNNGEWYGCWLYCAILANEIDKPGRDDFCSCGERTDNA